MGTNIRLTESQINRLMKQMVSEEIPSVDNTKTFNVQEVATRIPTKHVNELKKVIYNWGKTKGLQLPISDKIIK